MNLRSGPSGRSRLRRTAVLAAAAVAAAIVTFVAAPAAYASGGGCAPGTRGIGCLAPGDSGPDVKIWQQDLNFYMSQAHTCRPTLAVDGDYGPATTNATRCFQSIQGLSADGIAGPKTQGVMESYLLEWDPPPQTLYHETVGCLPPVCTLV